MKKAIQQKIHFRLIELFGKDAPAYQTITKFIRGLSFDNKKEPSEKVPFENVNQQNVDKVLGAIQENPNFSIRNIAQETGVPQTSDYRYLTQILHYKCVNLRWVPHILTDDLKIQRVEMSRQLLEIIQKSQSRCFHNVITGDESWFKYSLQPRHQWIPEGSKPMEKERSTFHNKKVMVTIFWGINGICVLDTLTSTERMNSQYFINNILVKITKSDIYKKVKNAKKRLIIHMDNCPVHKSNASSQFLSQNGFFVAPHPPYSPDLAPSDFFLFGYLKEPNFSLEFKDAYEVKKWIEQKFRDIPKSLLKTVFESWIKRLIWVIDNKGEYFPS